MCRYRDDGTSQAWVFDRSLREPVERFTVRPEDRVPTWGRRWMPRWLVTAVFQMVRQPVEAQPRPCPICGKVHPPAALVSLVQSARWGRKVW